MRPFFLSCSFETGSGSRDLVDVDNNNNIELVTRSRSRSRISNIYRLFTSSLQLSCSAGSAHCRSGQTEAAPGESRVGHTVSPWPVIPISPKRAGCRSGASKRATRLRSRNLFFFLFVFFSHILNRWRYDTGKDESIMRQGSSATLSVYWSFDT